MFFATPDANLPATTTTVQAGTAADLQTLLNEAITALIAGITTPDVVLGVALGAAGDGSQFAATLLTASDYGNLNFLTTAGNAIEPPLLATFDDATDRSVILFGQGGTAVEAVAALADAVAVVKGGSPPISGTTQQYGYELIGSANGQQWLAATAFFNGTSAP